MADKYDIESLKKTLRPADIVQFSTLHAMISGGKVLNKVQQDKYDSYVEQVESISTEEESPFFMYRVALKDVCNFFDISKSGFYKW